MLGEALQKNKGLISLGLNIKYSKEIENSLLMNNYLREIILSYKKTEEEKNEEIFQLENNVNNINNTTHSHNQEILRTLTPKILNKTQNSLKSFEIYNIFLSPFEFKKLAHEISKCFCLVTLKIMNCYLNPNAILEVLEDTSIINNFYFNFNEVNVNCKKEFSKLLIQNKGISNFELKVCKLNLIEVLSILKKDITIKSLDISENFKANVDEYSVLMNFFKENHFMQRLSLSDCNLTTNDLFKISTGVKHNKTIVSLDLSCNIFSKGEIYLYDIIQNTYILERLNIKNCRLEFDTEKILISMLEGKEEDKTLVLDQGTYVYKAKLKRVLNEENLK